MYEAKCPFHLHFLNHLGAILKPGGQNFGIFWPPLPPYVVIFISEPYLLMWFFGGPPSPLFCPRSLRMPLYEMTYPWFLTFLSIFDLLIRVKINGDKNSSLILLNVNVWNILRQRATSNVFQVDEKYGKANKKTKIAFGHCNSDPNKPKEKAWEARSFGKTWSMIMTNITAEFTAVFWFIFPGVEK